MLRRSYWLLLAAAMTGAPMVASLAQQNNPAGNLGSNRSETAAPGTADNKAVSGMNTGDAGSRTTATGNYGGSSMNTSPSGTAGRTVAPSTTSQASPSSK